jgi:hypothetical protein
MKVDLHPHKFTVFGEAIHVRADTSTFIHILDVCLACVSMPVVHSGENFLSWKKLDYVGLRWNKLEYVGRSPRTIGKYVGISWNRLE